MSDGVGSARVEAKDEERQVISDQVEAFLRKGGEIRQYGPEHNAQAKFNPTRSVSNMRQDMKEATYREMVRRREYKESPAAEPKAFEDLKGATPAAGDG